MGQEIEFDADDWNFEEDSELTATQSDISLPSDFFKGNNSDMDGLDADSFNTDEMGITAYIGGEKIQIKQQRTDGMPATQEEEAFRRQIEDLFELLELEKKSDKTHGVRVYQTDSSPSRPWRFH